jgi:hypothetical protein
LERETKVTAASKTSTTKSNGISANLGLKPQVTLAAKSARAMESMQGIEGNRCTRITQQHRHSAIWWGFYIEDDYEQQAGINMSDDLLPTASFLVKHRNGPDNAVVPRRIDVEVASYWTIIASDTQDRTWIEKMILRGSEGPSYSNFCHMIALMVPSDLVEDCDYKATLQVECGPQGPSILDLEIHEEYGPIEVMCAIIGRKPHPEADYQGKLSIMMEQSYFRF